MRGQTNIRMESGILVVKEILKPTNAKFFKHVRLGDQIEIRHYLSGTVGPAGRIYASDYEVTNYSRVAPDAQRIKISGNNLMNRLENFKIESL